MEVERCRFAVSWLPKAASSKAASSKAASSKAVAAESAVRPAAARAGGRSSAGVGVVLDAVVVAHLGLEGLQAVRDPLLSFLLSRHPAAYCTVVLSVRRFRSARVRTWYHFEHRCTQSLLSGGDGVGGGGEGGRVFMHMLFRLRDPGPDCRDLGLPGRTHRGRVRRVGEE